MNLSKTENILKKKNISLVANYISGNLIFWSPNRSYWYTQNKIMLQNYMFVGGEKKEDFVLLQKKEKMFITSKFFY